MTVKKGNKLIPFDIFFNDVNVQWKTSKEKACHYFKNRNDFLLQFLKFNDEIRFINLTKNQSPKKHRFRYSNSRRISYSSHEDNHFDTNRKSKKEENQTRIKRISDSENVIRVNSRKSYKESGAEMDSNKKRDSMKICMINSKSSGEKRTRSTDFSFMENDNKKNEPKIEKREERNEDIDKYTYIKNECVKTVSNITTSLANVISSCNNSISEWIASIFQAINEDFSEISDEPSIFEQELPPLQIQKIRCNLIRLGNLTNPLTVIAIEIMRILRWKNPILSSTIFTLYMYSVYRGWLLCITMLGLVFIFIFAYFRSRDLDISTEEMYCSPRLGINLGLRNQLAITTFVLRNSQKYCGMACDHIEKLKNLILWKQPEITKFTFGIICVMTCVSFALPASEIFTFAAYYLGIHLFIVSFIFHRFPRLRRKYDKASQVYEHLMSDVMLAEHRMKEMKNDDKYNKKSPDNEKPSPSGASASSKGSLNNISGLVRNRFPEVPLLAWKKGRKVTLLEKKTLSEMITLGYLYLSDSLLMFDPIKDSDSDPYLFPLRSFAKIEKVNIHDYIPGGGQGIKIRISTNNKYLYAWGGKVLIFLFQMELFSTILNRDEAYNSIMKAGKRKRLSWAFNASS